MSDYCSAHAQTWHITQDEIESYNTNTWGWMVCESLQAEAVICLSSGDPGPHAGCRSSSVQALGRGNNPSE